VHSWCQNSVSCVVCGYKRLRWLEVLGVFGHCCGVVGLFRGWSVRGFRLRSGCLGRVLVCGIFEIASWRQKGVPGEPKELLRTAVL